MSMGSRFYTMVMAGTVKIISNLSIILSPNPVTMKSFTVPTYDQVADNAKPAFDRFIKITGKMPNLYATIGYSANALNSYLAYVNEQARGTFHANEREA